MYQSMEEQIRLILNLHFRFVEETRDNDADQGFGNRIKTL